MKKLRVFLVLGLSLVLLAGCGRNNSEVEDPPEMSQGKVETQTRDEDQEARDRALDQEEEDLEEAGSDLDEVFASGSPKDQVLSLISRSDYISRVELASTPDDDLELRILDNYKGNLSNIEFETPSNLAPNKVYLIFYKDDEDGNIAPTHGTQSFIALDGDDAFALDVVEDYFGIESDRPEDDDQEDNKQDNNNED